MALKHVNAVVVGAGAGGGIVAKELAEGGLNVVLLERGKWEAPFNDRKDDLRNQRLASLGNAFGPDEERNPRVFVDLQRQEHIVWPSEDDYNNNAACVGGGTVSYGGMAFRFMEQDFRMRSTYGQVQGSTLEDWPISYQDLEPYYEKAEWEIGVSGDDSNNIFRAPRKRPVPMPPHLHNREYSILKPAAQRLGLHPWDVTLLRNTVPYNGRGPCMRCRWCVGFACEVDAKNGTQNTVIPKALATGGCELRTECMTREILTNSQGHVRGVAYFDSNGHLQEQTADVVVVSCGANESARLLLNSKSRLFPNGLGNRYDWVGRNLHGHAYPQAWGLFDYEVYDDLGPTCSIAICDYNHGNAGLVGGGLLANDFTRLPIEFVSWGISPAVPTWGKEHKNFMRQWFKRSILITGPVQEMPVFEARVQVDSVVKDYWGIPVARLSGGRHPNDIKVSKFLSSKAEEWLKEAGAVTTWNVLPDLGLSGGQHQAGTCRMGNDPKTSVVNKYCQVHDIDNLFVVDASVHVTTGGFNPVLTIMANAYRASEHIVNTWKGTKFA
jgi:choline dehydrogenase-like flavoprotein